MSAVSSSSVHTRVAHLRRKKQNCTNRVAVVFVHISDREQIVAWGHCAAAWLTRENTGETQGPVGSTDLLAATVLHLYLSFRSRLHGDPWREKGAWQGVLISKRLYCTWSEV